MICSTFFWTRKPSGSQV